MEDALVVVDAAMEGEMNCRNATPNATRITRSAARCMRCEDMGTKRTAPVRRRNDSIPWCDPLLGVLLHATNISAPHVPKKGAPLRAHVQSSVRRSETRNWKLVVRAYGVATACHCETAATDRYRYMCARKRSSFEKGRLPT